MEKRLKDGKITLEEFRKLLITFSNLENYISEKDEYVKQEVASMGDKDYIFWSDRIELKAKAESIAAFEEEIEKGATTLTNKFVTRCLLSYFHRLCALILKTMYWGWYSAAAVYECVTGTFSLDESGTPVKGAAIISFVSDGSAVTSKLVDVVTELP